MASSYSTKSSRCPKSSAADGFQKGFYGTNPLAQNKGISLLKKKKKQREFGTDINRDCKNIENFKRCADKVHSALMLNLVENKSSADTLATSSIPSQIPVDPGYQHCSDFLAGYDIMQKHGLNEVKTDSLDEAVKVTKKLADEKEKYVRMQLETLKPLTNFIGEEYWEFAKARQAFFNAVDKCESVNSGNKSIRPEPSQPGVSVDKTKADTKERMMTIVYKLKGKREEYTTCVLKFFKQASEWHKNAGSILSPFDAKTNDEYKPKAEVGESKSPAQSSRTKKVTRRASKEHSSR